MGHTLTWSLWRTEANRKRRVTLRARCTLLPARGVSDWPDVSHGPHLGAWSSGLSGPASASESLRTAAGGWLSAEGTSAVPESYYSTSSLVASKQ